MIPSRWQLVLACLLLLAACQTWKLHRLTREVDDAIDRGAYLQVKDAGETLVAAAEKSPDLRARIHALTSVAKLRRHLDRPEEAMGLDNRALGVAQSMTPSDPALLARPHMGLGIAHKAMGHMEDAETELKQAVALYEASGSRDADYVVALRNLSNTYRRQGRADEATEIANKALITAKQLLGPTSAEAATCTMEVARLRTEAEEYESAETLYDEALTLLEQHPAGSSSRDLGFILLNRGSLYESLSRYSEAGRDFGRAIGAFEASLGPDHSETLTAKIRFCNLQSLLGSYREAEALCLQALRTAQRSSSTPTASGADFLVPDLLVYLADISFELGKLREAESYLVQARTMLRSFGDRERTFNALNGLGTLYLNQGLLEEGAVLLTEAVAPFLDASGKPTEHRVPVLGTLAMAAWAAGDQRRAHEIYAEVLKELQDGQGGINRSILLSNMVATCKNVCSPSNRLALAREAVTAAREEFGDHHSSLGSILLNLAVLYSEQGTDKDASEALQEALRIFESTGSPLDPETTRALRLLGWSQARMGLHAEAFRTLDRMETLEEAQLRVFLGVVSEARQRAFLQDARTSLDYLTSTQQRWFPGSQAARGLVLRALLRRQARSLESTRQQLASARATEARDESPILSELREARSDLAALALRGPGSLPVPLYRERLDGLLSREKELEAKLAAESNGSDQEVTVEGIAARLPRRSVLLEIVRYEQPGKTQRARYALYGLKAGAPIVALDVGDAKKIDRLTARFSSDLAVPGSSAKTSGRTLDAKVLEPLRSFLQDVDHVYVVPDGAFSVVPFAALVAPNGRFRLENLEFTYLNSGRDLLAKAKTNPHSLALNPPLVMGGPDFGVPNGSPPAVSAGIRDVRSNPIASSLSRDFRGRQFEQLPAAIAEAEYVAQILGASPVTGSNMTEERLKSARSPLLLHLATHGFFLQDLPVSHALTVPGGRESLPLLKEAEDSMLRSGVALAGANAERSPGGTDDGILTALEASTLNLSETELVVLSGCETGLGQIERGEGVLGLRRAFSLAGAHALVMSLWSVNDTATSRLMASFYRRIQSGEGVAAALRAVQRELLADPVIHDPYYWASFVASGQTGPLRLARSVQREEATTLYEMEH